MKRVAIVQSNYIPWKGYFDIIRRVDEFVLYDQVQFTKRDWRNRNRIKTPQGLHWLTIPVTLNSRSQSIREIRVAHQKWRPRHWETLRRSYLRTPWFNTYAPAIEELYLNYDDEWLSDINYHFITNISAMLGITTRFRWSSEFTLESDRTERLVSICRQCDATVYLSGPAARDYLDESCFNQAGISVEWMNYDGYPEYDQPHPPFEHSVSALDLLFCTGPQGKSYMLPIADPANHPST